MEENIDNEIDSNLTVIRAQSTERVIEPIDPTLFGIDIASRDIYTFSMKISLDLDCVYRFVFHVDDAPADAAEIFDWFHQWDHSSRRFHSRRHARRKHSKKIKRGRA